MAGESVRVVARITSQPDKVEELKSVLLGLVEPTRLEKGCISYQLAQDKSDLAEFVFIEEWTSDSAIDAHMTSSHVQDAFSKAQSLLVKVPDIRKYGILR
jgi:quinol monooxygenase YgiN